MPQALSRSLSAAILSGALHGSAFWAARVLGPEPGEPSRRPPRVDLVTIVEVKEPLPLASQPGVEPERDDAVESEAPKDVSLAPEEREVRPAHVDPTPKAIPSAARASKDDPPEDSVAEPQLEAIAPVVKQRALPNPLAVNPTAPHAGLIRIPQGRPSQRRPFTAASKSSSKRRTSDRAKGGRKGNRNPILLTALDRELRRFYPNDAREAGIEGHARLELVVTRWGRPESIRIVSSHGHPAFGEACVRAVKRSRWRPAKDRSGRRIAMRVRYRCRFTVDR